jgi:hypothetical protein
LYPISIITVGRNNIERCRSGTCDESQPLVVLNHTAKTAWRNAVSCISGSIAHVVVEVAIDTGTGAIF